MPQSLTSAPAHRRFQIPGTIVFHEILTMGVDSLRADKVRAAMTALGMAVGTAALILVVTVALTGKTYVLAQIEAVGTNVIWAEYSGMSSASTSTVADFLTANDMIAVEQQVPGLKEASVVVNLHERIALNGGKEQDILVLGVDPEYKTVRRMIVSSGRFFDRTDAQTGNKVAVVTEPLARAQFGSLDMALGQTIKIHEVPFVIVGTFRESVDTLGRSEIADDTVLIPYSVARSMTGTPAVNQIYFSMYDASSIPAATQEHPGCDRGAASAGVGVQRRQHDRSFAPGDEDGDAFTAVLLLFAAVTLIAAGRGHYEHHAGDRALAHSRDRRAQGRWCDPPRHPAAVSFRSGPDCAVGRNGRYVYRVEYPDHYRVLHQLPGSNLDHSGSGRADCLLRSGHYVWNYPGKQCRAP